MGTYQKLLRLIKYREKFQISDLSLAKTANTDESAYSSVYHRRLCYGTLINYFMEVIQNWVCFQFIFCKQNRASLYCVNLQMLDFLSNFKGRLILLEALFFYYLILSHTVIHIFQSDKVLLSAASSTVIPLSIKRLHTLFYFLQPQ